MFVLQRISQIKLIRKKLNREGRKYNKIKRGQKNILFL